MIRLTGLPADFRAATAFGFTPDGRQLAVGFQTTDPLNWSVLWWDWAANRVVRERRGPTLTLGGDRRFVSTLDCTKTPVVRVYAAGAETLVADIPVDDPGRTLSVPAHVVAPGGEEVVVEHAGRLGFHRLPDWAEASSSKVGKGNTWMEFSPSARWLFCRSARAVRLWDRRSGHKLVRLKSDSHTTAAVSADDKYAAVTGPTGQAVTVWELATQAAVLRIDLSFIAQGLAWLPDGRLMLTVGREGVKIWDVGAQRECSVFTPPGGMGTRLAVGPDGLVAAALMYERAGATAVVWDL